MKVKTLIALVVMEILIQILIPRLKCVFQLVQINTMPLIIFVKP
jgi:hypothetical protein